MIAGFFHLVTSIKYSPIFQNIGEQTGEHENLKKLLTSFDVTY